MPPLVKISPSGRLAKVPTIGFAEILSITVKDVPWATVPLPIGAKVRVALLMLTPSAVILPAVNVVRFSTHL